MIIADIVILKQYVYYSYYLEFYPKHLPSILGYFLACFIAMCSFVVANQNYLKSYIGSTSDFYVEIAEAMH